MKKRTLGSLIALILLTSLAVYGCGGTDPLQVINSSQSTMATEDRPTGYKDISPDELKTMMETNKELIVVDVREQFEWDRYGHLPGSILIPVSQFQARLGELPRDKPIAIVCASGSRSPAAADYMIQMGYREVYNLETGLAAWPERLAQ